jgi:hypothetical protein
MANETENFDRLIQLLALKRHEQPPPGYFDRLSREIRLEIEGANAPEASLGHRLRADTDWFRRLLRSLEARPYLAGVFGVCVCALVLSGIVYSEYLDRPDNTVTISSFSQAMPLAGMSAIPVADAETNSSIRPVASPLVESLFNGGLIKSQPANFDLSSPH